MKGWRCGKYHHEDDMNVNKYFGRKLYVQDNYWQAAKVVMVILAGLVIVFIIKGYINLSGVQKFIEWLR